MKRTELIEILRSKIKTLKCADFNEVKDDLLNDEEGNPINDSILVSETKIRPWKIAENYGIGIETEYWGQKIISKKDDKDGFKKCAISITDYKAYGNYHCYGEVSVNHATWENIKTGSHTLSTELDRRFPEVEHTISWNVDRLLFEDDIVNGKGDWHGYEANETTERFDSYDELLLTAIYTILVRIEGPLKIQNDVLYVVVPDKDILVTVDKDDNVTLRSDIDKLINK
jgi:hypothetical protein